MNGPQKQLEDVHQMLVACEQRAEESALRIKQLERELAKAQAQAQKAAA